MSIRRLIAIMALLTGCIFGGTAGYTQSLDSTLTLYVGKSTYPNPDYDSVVLVEFPFSLNRHELRFQPLDSSDTRWYAFLVAQVNLFDTSGAPVDSNSILFPVQVDNKNDIGRKGLRVFNRITLLVKPGTYTAHVTVVDAFSKRKGEVSFEPFTVGPLVTDRIHIGGLSLAYAIDYVGDDPVYRNAQLIKNGYQIIPNPLAVWSKEDKKCYLYGEVYNLAYREGKKSKYSLLFTAYRENDGTLQFSDTRTVTKPGSTAVFVKVYDITLWPAGRYRLEVIAKDGSTKTADTASLQMTILPRKEVMQALTRPGGFDSYDTLRLEEKLHLVHYLLTPEEQNTLKRLSKEGKINFLKQFWEEHDENPATAVNEKRYEMVKRLEYCNRFFSTNEAKTNGWATDRGRIYMTYGPWDEIDDVQTPKVGNPYQIWYYRAVKEGKVFVFEDKNGTHDYRLVHSNVYGEVYDPAWQDVINTGILPAETDE